jgi:hypothetical protein
VILTQKGLKRSFGGDKMNKTIVGIVICVMVFASSFTSARQSENEFSSLKLVSQAYTIEKNEEYHRITMEGFSINMVPGVPQLPERFYDIELPSDIDVSTLHLKISSKTTYTLPGKYEIQPCPLPVTEPDTLVLESIVDGKDVNIYESNEFYPLTPVEIIEIYEIEGKKVARIRFTPLQYNPVLKILQLNKEIDTRIWWRTEFLEFIKREQQKEKKNGYAIITTNAIVDHSAVLSDFVINLRSRGFNVYTVTEKMYGTDTGQKRAINIRKWLKANYQDLDIEYVLLIGNPDPDDPSDRSDSIGDIPMMMCWPDIYEADPDLDNPVPTDYFYADLTGDWDADNDGFFGEYIHDAVDFKPEVYVGRIPVYHEDYAALDNILNKIIFYGCCSKRILLPMAILKYEDENGDETENRMDGRHLPQRVIENIATPKGYDYCVMYERKGLDPVPIDAYGYTKPLKERNVIEEWAKGYGIVFWWAYGKLDQARRKYWSEAKEDGDGIPEESEMEFVPFLTSESELVDSNTFVFQCTGGNGYPEDSNNLGYALLKQGAISTVCASRFYILYVCDWDIKNDVDGPTIGYNYIYHLVRQGEPAGKALYTAKSSLTNHLKDGGWRNLFAFNLYGDPSLTVVPYESIASPGNPISSDRPGYAIITTEEIKNKSLNLRKFVINLRSRGFNVYTVTEKMYGTDTGQQRAINIKKWLKANYQNLGIEYVLLIGNPNPDNPSDDDPVTDLDPDGGFGDIPMMMCFPEWDHPVPTDYFYADMTGDWDADNDGFFGEHMQDAVDLEPEVYVGRIPVYHEDYATLDNILKRTISYECCNKSMLFLMAISHFANENGGGGGRADGRHLPEIVIKNIATPKGYDHCVMYERKGLDPVPIDAYGYTKPLKERNVIEEWAKGYGIVFWWSHGNGRSSSRKIWMEDKNGNKTPEWDDESELEMIPFLTSYTTLSESNTFTFQASCGNGHPEFSDNLGYAPLKNGSAICTVSASRCTRYLTCFWGYENGKIRQDTDEATIGYWYIHYLVLVGEPAGKALYTAKSQLGKPGDYGDIFVYGNILGFNLYGDPSLTA